MMSPADRLNSEPARFAAMMEQLGEWYQRGKLKPYVSATMPLERAAETRFAEGEGHLSRWPENNKTQ
jgi:NADPH:quinone reductase-like Zn-dependent oxidoreductase